MTAEAQGGEAVLQTLLAQSSGQYCINIAGANQTLGLYNLQVTLNAALEDETHGGSSNDSLGSAQDLAGAFVALPGNGSRAAVLGQMNKGWDLVDYYSFAASSVGQSISLGVHSNTGTATLELFDANGNLVALGTSGPAEYDQVIANMVVTATGTYYVEVQGTFGMMYNLVITRGLALDTEPNNTQAQAQDITATRGASEGGPGAIESSSDADWYNVNTKAGDHLQLTVRLPFSGFGQSVDGLGPVITLYDPNGTQVASSNLSLTYKVPAGDAGLYAVCVTGAAGTQGEYVLSVTGETGALAPVTVTNVNPAAGTLIQSPASVTVDFSQSIYLPSLSASELTITDLTHPGQGTITATGYTVVNDHEVTWYLPSGFNGSSEDNRLDIAGGQIQDLSDVTLAAFSEDFTTDNVAPTVVATSIEEGSILPVGTGNLTYVVTFSQPMDPSNVSTASFDLHGNFLQADYTPVSFSFNPTDTQLTITYANLPNDAYTLTLFSKMAVDGGPITNSNGFCNLVGLGLDGEPHTPRPPSVPSGDGVPGGNFSVDFGLSLGTTAFPAPLQPVNPLGSLIYQGSTTGWIVAPGDFDTFTLNLNPGQTVTVDVTTSSPLLTTVSLIAPDGVTVLGSAAATAYGQEVVLQDVPVPSAGTYSVEIGALSGSGGELPGFPGSQYRSPDSGSRWARGDGAELQLLL